MRPQNIEAIILLLVFFTFGYLIGKKLSPALYNLEKRIRRSINVKRYHIHHDLGGIFLVLSSILFSSVLIKTALAGLGLGLFIQHIMADGLKLITKD
jgi:hypothetical protein